MALSQLLTPYSQNSLNIMWEAYFLESDNLLLQLNRKCRVLEGLEEGGYPQSPRGEQESSDLPSLVRKTIESNGTYSRLYPIKFISGFGLNPVNGWVVQIYVTSASVLKSKMGGPGSNPCGRGGEKDALYRVFHQQLISQGLGL
eukprot:1154788-Pelagomonas_calceolata.AAC.3